MAALFFVLACKLPSDPHSHGADQDSDTSTEVDVDQDGYAADVDCNDADASVHPDAKETCGNGQDDNCNGEGDGCPWEGESPLEGWELSGSEPDEQFGATLAVCDADGDGQQDLVVGSAGTNDDAGAVHVFYGPFGEETAVPRVWTILGTGPSTTFGSALDCQSDMTGDGGADLLVGEPDETGKTAGAMYVVPGGSTGETPIADAYVSAWGGVFDGDRFGYGVVALDLDGDHEDEIAVTSVGAAGSKTLFGVTYVVGSSPGTHAAKSADDYVYGTPDWFLVAGAGNAGDLNGDGIDELALTGRQALSLGDLVFVYQREWSGPLAAGDFDAAIATSGALSGRWVQLDHADLDGDGHDDFLVGNPDDDDVLVFDGVLDGGTDHDPSLEIVGPYDSFAGKAITSPGDLDGDGRDELLIGAPGEGAVYLFAGGGTGHLILDEAQASWRRAEDGSDAGAALSTGNLTNDAVSDFVIGVPLAGDENQGAVVLIPSLDL
jgi:hypothetical protein